MNETEFTRLPGEARRFTPLLLSLCLLFAVFAPVRTFAEGEPLITTTDELIQAISDAESGDIIYVGDIDFTPKPGLTNKLMRILLNKSVTIKNGKASGPAVFTNGSFNLRGGKIASERLNCSFEGIVFDGGIDGTLLTERDWELPYSEIEQEYTSDEPIKAQYAFTFGGNADVSFSGCDFKNYMFGEGGAFRCFYGDYSADTSLLAMFGDYTGCTLNIRLDKCNFTDNSAYYSGGAVYLDGLDGNVVLTATDCNFTGNRSATTEYSTGGGAIYAFGSKVTLIRCNVKNNTANHLYSDELPDMDITQGGAFYCMESELRLTDCIVADNMASVGGGIALINTKAEIDGCVIAGNRAEFQAVNSSGLTGPWNNMGCGGALYYSSNNVAAVTVVNTSIYANTANNAYGGVYPFYNNEYISVLPHGFGHISFLFCSYAGNTCDVEYDYSVEMFDWYQRPGDIWGIPYVDAYGCLIVDGTFHENFPKYAAPSVENNYNYIASTECAETDGIEKVSLSDSEYGHYIPNAPESIVWGIPKDFGNRALNGRYNGEIGNFHVGSNYSAALYQQKDSKDNTAVIIIAVAATVVVVGAVILLVLRRREKAKEAAIDESNTEPKAETEAGITTTGETASIPAFMKQFSYEQIDTILAAMPESQLLTSREREVVREILNGKKQREIAFELGIEVSTLRDFNRKIYAKYDVLNKEELIRKATQIFQNQIG